jgi:uncharacterized protein YciU (UPF0263 family)
VDGDGAIEFGIYADGADGEAAGSGVVYLMDAPPPGDSSVEAVATATFPLTEEGNWPACVELGGDTDGDGLGELAVGRYALSEGGAIALFRDLSGTVAWDDADVLLESDDRNEGVGSTVLLRSDLDGDGLIDLAANRDGYNELSVWSLAGASDVELDDAFATIEPEYAAAAVSGGDLNSVLAPGDMDGDDWPDVVLAFHHTLAFFPGPF